MRHGGADGSARALPGAERPAYRSQVLLRLLYTPYFLLAYLLGTCPVIGSGALLPAAAVAAYLLMIGMSAVWLLQMLRNGVADFCSSARATFDGRGTFVAQTVLLQGCKRV